MNNEHVPYHRSSNLTLPLVYQKVKEKDLYDRATASQIR